MVAITAPAGMPNRQFSGAIVGAVWPQTDPMEFQSAAEALHAKGVALLDCATAVRAIAASTAAGQSGEAIDGFCGALHRLAATYTDQADRYFALARGCEECGRLTYGLREDLDQIDAEAHRAIEQIMAAVQAGAPAALAGQEIAAIIAAARAAGAVQSAEVTAAITAEAANLGLGAPKGHGGQVDPVDPQLRELASHGGPAGSRGPGGMPQGRIPGGNVPSESGRLPGGGAEAPAPRDDRGELEGAQSSQDGSATENGAENSEPVEQSQDSRGGTQDGSPSEARPSDQEGPAKTDSPVTSENGSTGHAGAGEGDAAKESPRDSRSASLLPQSTGTTASPAISSASSSATSGSTPTSSLGTGGGIAAAGVPKVPAATNSLGSGLTGQGLGSGSGLSSGALPAGGAGAGAAGGVPGAGVGSAGGASGVPRGMPAGGAGVPPVGVGVPPASSADFSRGLSAGLGSGGPGAPFAPPVSAQPAAAAGSASLPAGAPVTGPAPSGVGASAGGPVASPMPAMPLAAAGPIAGAVGGAGVPSAPAGPLPPFGSDIPRAAAGAGAVVTPSSGAPTVAPAAGGGGPAGPVASLPPGVVGSGVGASAGATSEAVRSSLPDPLLASASQLVYQLLHDSRMYPYMDWAVGVFRTASGGIETVIVNSEGGGYIPPGVFVPRSARMLFADSGLSPEFRARWFSWANPAETMLAYAALAAEHGVGVELWALAVSTDDGGSSMPARSTLAHFEECSRSRSPIAEGEPVSQLDDRHVHRLETMDRDLYARLTGFGDGRLPDRSEAWRTTLAAAQMALGQAGGVPDLAVPPAIRAVLELLGQGVPVPAARWQELVAAHMSAVLAGAGLRPGRFGSNPSAAGHVVAHHNLARLMELLLLWNLQSGASSRDVKYAEIAYLAGQIQLSPRSAGVGA